MGRKKCRRGECRYLLRGRRVGLGCVGTVWGGRRDALTVCQKERVKQQQRELKNPRKERGREKAANRFLLSGSNISGEKLYPGVRGNTSGT